MPDRDPLIPPLMAIPSAVADLPRWVDRYLRRENLCAPGDRMLVAVSGGPDSVALLHLLNRLQAELQITLGVAHFDHGLRGRESREEAEFVAALAQSLSLPFYPGEGDTRKLAGRAKISLQMAARRLRLNFLKDTCRSHGYQKLALGHTADDQVELFFLRLLKGAGPEGLAGMPPATPQGLVRPLLAVGKEVILAWLRQESLSYCRDPSNLKRDYLRNRVRLDLLPQLEHYNPRVREAVWRAQAWLQEEEGLVAPEVARAWAEVVEVAAPDFYRLHLSGFFQLPGALRKLVLRRVLHQVLEEYPLSAVQVDAVLDLARAEKSGGLISLGTCRAARAGGELHIFRRLPAPSRESGLLPSCPGRFAAGGWSWRLDSRPYLSEAPRPRAAAIAWMDPDRVQFPLEIRGPRPGDRFRPTGAAGSRKLQDFLVDRKIPRWLRSYLPLALSRGEIIWVAGLRVAEPVKLTAASRNVLEMEITPGNADTRRIWEMMEACEKPYFSS